MKTYILIILAITGLIRQGEAQSNVSKTVENALTNYYQCRFLKTSFEDCFLPFAKESYSEKSKQILSSILERKWDQGQLTLLAENVYKKQIENKIKVIDVVLHDTIKHALSKNRKKFYVMSRDSLHKILQSDDSQGAIQFVERIKNTPITKEIIYLAGMVDDTRFISILKNALIDSIHFDSSAVCLALARLKVEPYYAICLKKYSVTPSQLCVNEKLDFQCYQKIITVHRQVEGKLIYMGTAEAIDSYCSFLQCEFYAPTGDEYYSPVHAFVIYNLQRLIRNRDFQRHFESKDPFSNDLTMHDVEWVRSWLVENKKKLDFNFTYLPNSFF